MTNPLGKHIFSGNIFSGNIFTEEGPGSFAEMDFADIDIEGEEDIGNIDEATESRLNPAMILTSEMVMSKVFSFLPPKDLANAYKTCKNWRDIVGAPPLQKFDPLIKLIKTTAKSRVSYSSNNSNITQPFCYEISFNRSASWEGLELKLIEICWQNEHIESTKQKKWTNEQKKWAREEKKWANEWIKAIRELRTLRDSTFDILDSSENPLRLKHFKSENISDRKKIIKQIFEQREQLLRGIPSGSGLSEEVISQWTEKNYESLEEKLSEHKEIKKPSLYEVLSKWENIKLFADCDSFSLNNEKFLEKVKSYSKLKASVEEFFTRAQNELKEINDSSTQNLIFNARYRVLKEITQNKGEFIVSIIQWPELPMDKQEIKARVKCKPTHSIDLRTPPKIDEPSTKGKCYLTETGVANKIEDTTINLSVTQAKGIVGAGVAYSPASPTRLNPGSHSQINQGIFSSELSGKNTSEAPFLNKVLNYILMEVNKDLEEPSKPDAKSTPKKPISIAHYFDPPYVSGFQAGVKLVNRVVQYAQKHFAPITLTGENN